MALFEPQADKENRGNAGGPAAAACARPLELALDKASARSPGKQKTSWLSALVAETPQKPAAHNARIVLQNQFLVETSSPAAGPGREQVSLRRVVRDAEPMADDAPTKQAEYRRYEQPSPGEPEPSASGHTPRSSTAESIFASGREAAAIAALGLSSIPAEDSRKPQTPESEAPECAPDPLPTCDPLSRASNSPFRSPQTPRSSGNRLSAANAWLSSQRGDWYCSSARAKAAAASIGLSPMPLDDLLALPVPPLFLAADQQERLRMSSSRRSAKSDGTQQSPPNPLGGSQQASPVDSSRAWRTRQNISKPTFTPQDGGNDFAERPDTIWKAPMPTRSPGSRDIRDTRDMTDKDKEQYNDFAAAHNDFAAVHARQSLPTPRVLSPRPIAPQRRSHPAPSSRSDLTERSPPQQSRRMHLCVCLWHRMSSITC
jgi:hypothetical protein